MAATADTFIIRELVNRLVQLVEEKRFSLIEIRDPIYDLVNDLKSLNTTLDQASKNERSKYVLKEVVDNTRDVISDAEDAICMYSVLRKKKKSKPNFIQDSIGVIQCIRDRVKKIQKDHTQVFEALISDLNRGPSIQELINRLVQVVQEKEKACVIKWIKDKMDDLVAELEVFNANLKQSGKSKPVKHAVEKIRNLVTDAEDAIDKYSSVVMRNKYKDKVGPVFRLMEKISYYAKVHDSAIKIQRIADKDKKIRQQNIIPLLPPLTHRMMNTVTETVDEDAKWDEKPTLAFLNILNERVQNCRSGKPIFKLCDWNEMDRQMIERTQIRYGSAKLKSKYGRLRGEYMNFVKLLSHTGVTYNAATNTVHVTPEKLEQLYKVNTTFKKLKKHGLKHYELYHEVFAKSCATRGLANASTQQPLNSDDERHAEDDFLCGAGTSSKGKRSLEDMMDIGVITKKSTNKKWKEEITDVLKGIGAVMSSRAERRSRVQEDGSTMSTAGHGPYSMTACIDILNLMKISNAAKSMAFKKLGKAITREGFIAMTPEWRLDWVLEVTNSM